MRYCHNFLLEGPIDLRPMRLNCILQDLFRHTPLDHIWCAQIRTQICQIWPNMHFWRIFAKEIFTSSGNWIQNTFGKGGFHGFRESIGLLGSDGSLLN